MKPGSVFESFYDDVKGREKAGVHTYGSHLHVFNQRKSLQDAYEEVIDLALYTKQTLLQLESILHDVDSLLYHVSTTQPTLVSIQKNLLEVKRKLEQC